MFTKQDKDELVKKISDLQVDIRKLRDERRAASEELTLTDEINDLKRELVDLEIERSKLTEDHEREKRETTHMVGLERKRQEFEIEQAKRETTVTVREENLEADRVRFEEQMDFMEKRMKKEVDYLQEIMSEVLERLPTVTVDRTTNGHDADAEKVRS